MLSFWSFVVPFYEYNIPRQGKSKYIEHDMHIQWETLFPCSKKRGIRPDYNSRHNKLKFSHVLTFQSIDLSLSRDLQTTTNIFCIMVTSFKYIKLKTRYNLKEWIFLYPYSYLFMKGLLVYSISFWGDGSKRKRDFMFDPKGSIFWNTC